MNKPFRMQICLIPLMFCHCIVWSLEALLAFALWLPLVTSRSLTCGGKVEFLIRLSGIQLLLIKVLAACESFGGSTWGNCRVACAASKDSVEL